VQPEESLIENEIVPKKRFNFKNPLLLVPVAVTLLVIGTFGAYQTYREINKEKIVASAQAGIRQEEATVSSFKNLPAPIIEEPVKPKTTAPVKTQPVAQKEILPDISIPKPYSIALLGFDRRSKSESPFRTDTIMILSLSQDRNKLLMTSIPRDLWIDGARINSFYSQGPTVLKQKLQKITSFPIDRYIGLDFEDYKWLIDFFGGVDVNVDRAFTDTEYPVDWNGSFQTVTFEAGIHHLNGERALQFSRSRHGNNTEGNDFMRALRQQKVIKSLATSISGKCGNPSNALTCFGAISAHVNTDLTTDDITTWIESVNRFGSLSVNQVVLDYDYLYNPPMANYGGAWVIVPKDPSYKSIHNYLSNFLK